MRLFAAILFDENTIEHLGKLRDALHNVSSSGTFVSRENLHLTLEFLGECSEREKNEAIDAIDSIAFDPFEIKMDRVGFFSRPEGNTWWVGVDRSAELIRVQGELHSALLERGFSLEKRGYKPHITLARRVITTAAPTKIHPLYASAEKISLMRSDRVDGKLIYTELC